MPNKGTLIFAAACGALLVSGCDQGSVLNAEQARTDATTRLEAAGLDVRVYEFTPKTATHMQCIFVAGNKKGGLACFEKRGTQPHT